MALEISRLISSIPSPEVSQLLHPHVDPDPLPVEDLLPGDHDHVDGLGVLPRVRQGPVLRQGHDDGLLVDHPGRAHWRDVDLPVPPGGAEGCDPGLPVEVLHQIRSQIRPPLPHISHGGCIYLVDIWWRPLCGSNA